MTALPGVPLVLNGPGRVGLSFVELLDSKREFIQNETGKTPVLVAVRGRTGSLFCPRGLGLDDVLEWLERSSGRLHDLGGLLDDIKERFGVPGVTLEATPTNLVTGEPGLSHIKSSLDKGFSVVTLAKGPLVVAFKELSSLCGDGVFLGYSGAVGAALPSVDVGLHCMAGTNITGIEGVLNGTTNLILNRMSTGKPYEEALREAQAEGVAEADPTLDVDGYDSAAKILIIANALWGLGLGLSDVSRQGIRGMDEREVVRMARQGTPFRLVARALKGLQGVSLSVKPEPVASDHPFRFLPGTCKAVRFSSEEMGDVVVSGGASHVVGAAASALKDLVHIMKRL